MRLINWRLIRLSHSIAVTCVLGASAAFSAAFPNNAQSANQDEQARKKAVVIGTGRVGGDNFPMGIALAEVISRNTDRLLASAQETGGAVANTRLVSSGKIDVGITNTPTLHAAVVGEKPFQEKQDNLMLFAMFEQFIFAFAPEDSGIKSYADLQGKRFWGGPQGGFALRTSQTVLDVLDLSSKAKLHFMSISEAANLMRDGRLDAMAGWALGPSPIPFIMELGAVKKLRFFGPDDATLNKVVERLPGSAEGTFPANVYAGQESFKTTTFFAGLAVSSRMDEETGYLITKAIHENRAGLEKYYPPAKYLQVMGASRGITSPQVKWHPGAMRYMKEAGIWKH